MGKFDGILIASDLDGTLLWNGEASEENKSAIKYFIENGGMFTTATGRAPEFIKRLNITVNAPLITINGSLIYDIENDMPIKSFTFPAKMANVAKRLAEKEDIQRVSIYSLKEYAFPRPKAADFEFFDKPINKIVFVFNDEETTLRVKGELTEKYSPDFVFERSWPTGLEMRSGECGKGVCLKQIKELTGAKTIIAAGDWENDETLLKAADISYAPANAHPDILELADRVTVHCKNHVIEHIVRDIDTKGKN